MDHHFVLYQLSAESIWDKIASLPHPHKLPQNPMADKFKVMPFCCIWYEFKGSVKAHCCSELAPRTSAWVDSSAAKRCLRTRASGAAHWSVGLAMHIHQWCSLSMVQFLPLLCMWDGSRFGVVVRISYDIYGISSVPSLISSLSSMAGVIEYRTSANDQSSLMVSCFVKSSSSPALVQPFSYRQFVTFSMLISI